MAMVPTSTESPLTSAVTQQPVLDTAASTNRAAHTQSLSWADEDDDWSIDTYMANNMDISAPTLAELGPLQRPLSPEDLGHGPLAVEITTAQLSTQLESSKPAASNLEAAEAPPFEDYPTSSMSQLGDHRAPKSNLMLHEERCLNFPLEITTYCKRRIVGVYKSRRSRHWRRGLRSPLRHEVVFEEEEQELPRFINPRLLELNGHGW